MPRDSVTTNYNDTGTIIMEMIYADDFLSPDGARTTQALMELGNVDDGSRVLDIGSGLGGSAFYLAERKGCTVQGIDLMESNVADATRRAASRGLSARVGFATGDAASVPFANSSFDVVWGQDAWCHVEDKNSLIAEAYRVLAAGGLIVFSDWLLRDRQSTAADRVRQVTASPTMSDVQTYLHALETTGFAMGAHADTSAEHAAAYRDVLRRLLDIEAEICDRFGRNVFDIVLAKQQFVLDAFTEGVLGAGSFAARKPPAATTAGSPTAAG